MREVRFEVLRPAEVVDEMKQRPLIFVPVGPLEWHGPALPLGTDPLIAQGVARRVAAKVGGVVLPTLFVGTERERSPEQLRHLGFKGNEWVVGMDFPKNVLKSLYYPEEFLAMLMRGTLDLLGQQGYRLIVILNGHGATNHMNTLGRVAAEFTARGPAKVLMFSAWQKADGGNEDVGHAGCEETSQMMALHPASVDLSTLPPTSEPLRNLDWAIVDGPTFDGNPTPDFTTRDDPRVGSSPAAGEMSLSAATDYIARKVADALTAMGYTHRL